MKSDGQYLMKKGMGKRARNCVTGEAESYRQREVNTAEDVADRLETTHAVAEEPVANAVLRLLLNCLSLSEETMGNLRDESLDRFFRIAQRQRYMTTPIWVLPFLYALTASS